MRMRVCSQSHSGLLLQCSGQSLVKDRRLVRFDSGSMLDALLELAIAICSGRC